MKNEGFHMNYKLTEHYAHGMYFKMFLKYHICIDGSEQYILTNGSIHTWTYKLYHWAYQIAE